MIFLVNDVALAVQQTKAFEKFLGEYKNIDISGQTENAPPILKLLNNGYQIIVLTAQLLVNAMKPRTLEFKGVSDQIHFDHFSLMVIDECHHADRGHPYNVLMAKYVDMKLANSTMRLPQVIHFPHYMVLSSFISILHSLV